MVNVALDGLGLLTIVGSQRRDVGEKFGIAEDGSKRVTDFVRRTGGETAKRAEFLGVREASLDGFQVFEGGLRQLHKMNEFASQ